MVKLDSVDIAILSYLQEDCTMPVRELASSLNLSYTPVYERIKKLEKEGVIKNYVALIDPSKIGKSLLAFCNIALKEHSRTMGEKFVQAVRTYPEVLECYNISGNYDFILKVIVAGMPEYQTFLMEKLGVLENIGSTQSLFVMGGIKSTTGIPLYDMLGEENTTAQKNQK